MTQSVNKTSKRDETRTKHPKEGTEAKAERKRGFPSTEGLRGFFSLPCSSLPSFFPLRQAWIFDADAWAPPWFAGASGLQVQRGAGAASRRREKRRTPRAAPAILSLSLGPARASPTDMLTAGCRKERAGASSARRSPSLLSRRGGRKVRLASSRSPRLEDSAPARAPRLPELSFPRSKEARLPLSTAPSSLWGLWGCVGDALGVDLARRSVGGGVWVAPPPFASSQPPNAPASHDTMEWGWA